MVDSKENTIKEIIRMNAKLKRKRPFSENKLTIDEFNEKYWINGEYPYQYHSMTIEDGTCEREQLMINNIRSLKNSLTALRRSTARSLQEHSDENKKEMAHIKRSLKIIAVICAVKLGVSVIIIVSHIQRHHPIIRNRK